MKTAYTKFGQGREHLSLFPRTFTSVILQLRSNFGQSVKISPVVYSLQLKRANPFLKKKKLWLCDECYLLTSAQEERTHLTTPQNLTLSYMIAAY